MSWDNYDEHCNDHPTTDEADCEYCEETKMEGYPTPTEVSCALVASIRERLHIAEECVGLETPDGVRQDLTALRQRMGHAASMNLGQLWELYHRSGELVERVAHVAVCA